VIPDFKLIVLI